MNQVTHTYDLIFSLLLSVHINATLHLDNPKALLLNMTALHVTALSYVFYFFYFFIAMVYRSITKHKKDVTKHMDTKPTVSFQHFSLNDLNAEFCFLCVVTGLHSL